MNLRISKMGFLFVGVVCTSNCCYAEGGKNFGAEAHGVNRVIRLDSGYVRINGTVSINYTIPSAHLMPDVPASPEQLVSETPKFIRHVTNPFDNKPSAYFGGSLKLGEFTYETDAGLQLETNNYAFNPSENVEYPGVEGGGERLGRATGGWAAFISSNNGFTNPQVWNDSLNRSVPWRPAQGIVKADVDPLHVGDENMVAGSSSISRTLQCWVTLPGDSAGARGVGLNVGGLGSFYWNNNPDILKATAEHQLAPWTAKPVFPDNHYDDIKLKAVAAMTRRRASQTGAKTNYQLDGSEMTVKFTGLQVKTSTSSWGSIPFNKVSQGETGFDAPKNGAVGNSAWDSRWVYDGSSAGNAMDGKRTIVEFVLSNPNLSNEDIATYNILARSSNTNYDSLAIKPELKSALKSRYNSETIRINLHTIARPVGSAVVIPGR